MKHYYRVQCLLTLLAIVLSTVAASSKPDEDFLFPRIGISTSASAPVLQANGSYNIAYTFVVKNYGDEKLTSVQVVNAIGLTFISPTTYSIASAPVATGTLIVNPGFNGSSDVNMLSAGSFLYAGAQQTIVLTVNVVTNGSFGPFTSLPVASGTGTLLPVTDLSVNGNNPDPNGDGSPIETSPTLVSLIPFPVIGIAKSASSPMIQSDASYNVKFTLTIKNLGNEILNNVQVNDALTATFIAPTTFTVGPVVSTGALIANAGYNGTLGSPLLASGSKLGLGETQTITFTVNVKPNGLFGPFLNSATTSATGAGSGINTADISVDGNNPDPNADGIPLETLPTSVSLIPTPIIGVAKSASAAIQQPDLSNNITFTITVKNLGNEVLHNVQVTDALASAFVSPSTYSLVGGVVATGTLAANASFNGSINNNLLAAGSTLAVGATQTVTFTVNIKPNGLLGPFANTALASALGSLLPTTDISVDGNNPDPNGDGLPLEAFPTVVNLLPIPIIGVAKSAASPVVQTNGSYNVPFTITIKNLGNEILNNVQVTDNLLSTFVGPSTYSIVGNVLASGTLVANASFNGGTDVRLLQPGGTLAVGQTQTITFTVNVQPNGLFGLIANTAIASATGSLLPTTDISVDGTNPDPNGDGLPLETLPTIITLVPVPVIGIAKSATSPQAQSDGTYNVTFTLTLKNYGNEALQNVQVTDALVSAFIGPSTYKLVGNVFASGTLIANPNYNGNLIDFLLSPGSTLALGAKQTITFTVNVTPATAFGPFLNTAIATATGALLPTTDISQDGNDPDPNGDGLPLETSPTIVNLIPVPIIGLAKSASAPVAQPDGTYNLTYTFHVQNMGNVPLTNVQITDNMIGVFASPSVYKLVGGLVTSGSLVANAGFDGNLFNNLLSSGSTLAIGEKQTVSVTINVAPNALFGPFINTATATAQGGLLPTIDLSMDGNNPDPNGDGIPLETLPTIVNLIPVPIIGVSKSASTPLLQPDGSYNVTFTITAKNYGNEKLTDVQVTDLLISALPPPTLFTLTGPVVTTGTLIANPLYDGNLVSNLLASGSTLNIGGKETIKFTINIKPNLVFGPFVNTAVASASGSLLPTIDVSMDGNDPDPNGDGIPLELLPTTVLLVPAPSIGVAKNLISSVLQPDGSYNVKYGITLKNYGNVDLHNIKVNDDLATAFNLASGFNLLSLVATTGGLQANVNFNGLLDNNLLDGLTSLLGVGESQVINYTVNVKAGGVFGPYCNSASATATGPLGIGLTADVSTSGTDPDPNGNGNPSDASENDCTRLNLTSNPVIGLAKAAASPTLQSDGSYNVQYTFTLKNLGNTPLTNVTLTDDLSVALTSPVTFSVLNPPAASGTLTVNAAFNGTTNKNLLAAGSTLAIGATATVTLNLNVVPNGTFGPFFNSALATAKDANSATITTDLSTDGTNPDPNGNGNPGDANESILTAFSLTPDPVIGLAKASSAPILQANGSYTMTLTFTVANLGNVGLHDIQVTDNLANVFPSPATFTIVGAVTSPVSFVPNSSYNGTSDINLLGAGSTLAAGATEHITVKINVMPNGSFGPFFNTALASGAADGFGTLTTDTSTDGNNPDPNNNRNASDPGEDMPTTVSLSPSPVIGVAKAVTSSLLQPNGSYVVTFAVTIKNYGNVALNNVQVTDDLGLAFPTPTTFSISQAVSATGGLAVNTGFSGNTDINLLASGNTILPGETQTITFSVNVVVNGSFGPFYNSAKASAAGASGSGSTSDISTSGTNPDPNGNGNPSDANENVATTVSLTPNPVMGLAKSVSVPQIQSDGTYKVTYVVLVKNMGNVAFTNVQITDNLANAFPAPATYSLSGSVAVSGSMTANPSFNGSTDTNLLAAGNTLPIGVSETFTLQVIIQPNGSFGPFYNSATGTASSSAGMYSDVSASGTNPDPNGNGNPGDPGEGDPTGVTLTPQPILGVAKSAGSPVLQSDGSSRITYTITLKNMGNVALSNVQVTDDLRNTFVAPATYTVVGSPTASGLLVVNTSFDGSTNLNLLTSGTIATGATQSVSYTVAVQPHGNFGPFLNSAVGKGSSGSITYTDISNSGTNPDPNGNGNPGDPGEDTPTPVSLTANVIAGIAKAASLPLIQPDGTYKITYTLTVENLGNSAINNIQIKDYLISSFPAPLTYTVVPGSATTGTLIINPSFDGTADVNLLSAGSKLALGATHTVSFSVLVNLHGSSGIYYNRATVISTSDDNLTSYTDISNNGTDPDPNGNGNPGDVDENDPTPVTLTPHGVLGIAKSAGLPIQQADGSFDIVYTIVAENLGNVVLNAVQVTDDLAQTFPSPMTFTVSNLTTSDAVAINAGFNGKTDKNIFTTGGSLGVGAISTSTFIVHVKADGSEGTFYNSARGSALPVGGSGSATDVSANGLDPDPNGNGNPADPGEDGATPVTLILSPVVGVAKAAGIPILNTADGSYTVPFTITVQNLGNTPLTNVSVYDDMSLIFPAATAFTLSTITTSGTLKANAAYDAMTQVNLLDPTSTLAVGAKQTITFSIRITTAIPPGPYFNTAIAFASNSDGSLTYGDISTSGLNPDPNGNGNPNDANESIPTSFLLQITPVIGIANSASIPALQPDGSYNVTFTVNVENFGNETLDNIVLTDDLRNTFPQPITFSILAPPVNAGSLVANNAYDGRAQSNLIKSGSLASGEKQTFMFSINVKANNAFGLFWNQITATANGFLTSFKTNDVSDNGSNPDPNGNGTPDETDENDPTPVHLIPNKVLGLAKYVSAITSTGDCVYDVTYTFNLENFGNAMLRDVNISDDLSDAISDDVSFNFLSASSTSGLHINSQFNGTSVALMLAGSDSLVVGGKADVSITLRVTPGNNYGPFLNSATATAQGPDLNNVTDVSTTGENADPDGDKVPDEDDPTSLTIIPTNLFFPQGFSPNGDGVHDKYEISLACGQKATIRIYNRWGDKVYSSKNYQNDWDGYSNEGSFLGKPLPDGTYFYNIELSNGQKFTNFIILKR